MPARSWVASQGHALREQGCGRRREEPFSPFPGAPLGPVCHPVEKEAALCGAGLGPAPCGCRLTCEGWRLVERPEGTAFHLPSAPALGPALPDRNGVSVLSTRLLAVPERNAGELNKGVSGEASVTCVWVSW